MREFVQSNECEWSQKCEAATEERARREELAAQLLATQQDRYRILSERDALRAEVERMRAVVEAAREFRTVCDDWVDTTGWESGDKLDAALAALDGKEGEEWPSYRLTGTR